MSRRRRQIGDVKRVGTMMRCPYCDFFGSSRKVENHVRREHRVELFKKWVSEE